MDNIVITNETDAWNVLQQALGGGVDDTAQIVFEGWPVFKLTIQGTDFNGSIPTRIMPPILDLQREIHRIYCRAKYNTEDIRRLRDEERELLELVVIIKPGSTEFITELFKALNEVVKNSNMDGNQSVILLVSISVLITSLLAWKEWLKSRETAHAQDTTVRLSEQETERLNLITEALTRRPDLNENQKSISHFKTDLSKRLKPEDEIKIDDRPVVNGARAAEITRTPREAPREIRIDGEFVINEVKFPERFGGEYRFSVTRLLDDQKLLVDVAPDVLSEDQISILKDGSFQVKRVVMEVNAKQSKGRMYSAKLVAIKWPDSNR